MMKISERYAQAIAYFSAAMPMPQPELHYGTPFELLVAVILSAQCTDKRVNLVTPALFQAYPDAERMAQASADDIYEYVRSVSYPHNKSRHLAAMARMLVADFGGQVPSTGEELERLPGVGRKTANVIQAVIFQKARMAVDTHVFRVSHRLGLASARCTTPLSVERQLVRHIPAHLIPMAHHWLILHGRYVCQARRPRCSECGLAHFCPRIGLPKGE